MDHVARLREGRHAVVRDEPAHVVRVPVRDHHGPDVRRGDPERIQFPGQQARVEVGRERADPGVDEDGPAGSLDEQCREAPGELPVGVQARGHLRTVDGLVVVAEHEPWRHGAPAVDQHPAADARGIDHGVR